MNSLRQRVDDAPMNDFQWTAIAICMLLNMIDGFDVLVMAFTAAPVSAEWKLSGSQLGILLSAGLFGMAGGSLFIAPWADRIGRRPIILGCLALCGVTMVLAAQSGSYQQLATARVFTGLGIGGILACSNVLASEYASTRWRSLAVSLQSSGYALGATLGGSIAVWLLGRYDWRSVFLFGGILTMAVIPLVMWRLPESLDFLLVRRPPGALQRINSLARRLNAAPLAEMPSAVNSLAIPDRQRGIRTLFVGGLLRPTILVWASFFLVMFGFYFVMSWTPKLLVAAGMTTQGGVTVGVLLSVGGIFGSAAVGALAARFRVNQVLAAFMIFAAVLLSVFVTQAGSQNLSFLLALLIGVLVNGCVAGLYAIGPLVYDASVRVTGLGWGIGIGRIGAIVSPLAAGALIDNGWRPTQLYVGFGFTFAVAALVVLLHRIQLPAPGLNGRIAGSPVH